jgi:L-ascorbate metabolism protein UlaG (beta-lactamase superfamily)
MDIQFYGANCVVLSVQGTRVVVDDNLATLGAKSVAKADDVAVFTSKQQVKDLPKQAKLSIDTPGEYEIAGFSITGIPARAHLDEDKQSTNATIYKIVVNDVRAAVLGHIYPDLNGSELERLGVIDVLILPVGGNGYTLDPIGALSLIKKIEPKIVIPTHYADNALQYPVAQQTLEEAVKSLAMEPKQVTGKLRIKADAWPEMTELTILEKS